MLPTLKPSQLVFGFRSRKLCVGDVVIISHNGLEKIKRIEKQQGNLLYLLGDNPSASSDSRHFGWVQSDAVMATVIWSKCCNVSKKVNDYFDP